MTKYEEQIVKAFKDLCAINDGASPAEVTKLLEERKQLAALDSVIDIADQMRELRDQGEL